MGTGIPADCSYTGLRYGSPAAFGTAAIPERAAENPMEGPLVLSWNRPLQYFVF